jgi:hypothetical protein
VPRSERTPDETAPAEPEVTLSQPAKRPPEDDRVEAEEPAAGEPSAAAADDAATTPRERVRFGESNDLLADVDSGVNENEFKW